jgi:hypothetical protein
LFFSPLRVKAQTEQENRGTFGLEAHPCRHGHIAPSASAKAEIENIRQFCFYKFHNFKN